MSNEKRKCGKCGKAVTLPDDPTVQAIVDAAGSPLCDACFDDWRAKAEVTRPPEPVIVQRQTKYLFTPDMGEISGFGGGYEQTCRNMLAAGLEWLDSNPKAEPQFSGFKGVYGILNEDNADAKALGKTIVEASGNDCTGAMRQAVLSHCMFIRKNGWDRYCEEMRKREPEESRP